MKDNVYYYPISGKMQCRQFGAVSLFFGLSMKISGTAEGL